MSPQEQVHSQHIANVERIKKALALTIREMEAQLETEPIAVHELDNESTLALRGRIRVLVLGLRSLLNAVLLAKRNRDSDKHARQLERETQAAMELLTMLNESLD